MMDWLDANATHLPTLLQCVAHTNGPVLEIGAGECSTPVLHALCWRRRLVTVESDPYWYERMGGLRSPMHRIELDSPDYDRTLPGLLQQRWSVILVDHGPPRLRGAALALIGDRAEYVICHDTEDPVYGFEAAMPGYKYRRDFKTRTPWTTVVSNLRSLDDLEEVS